MRCRAFLLRADSAEEAARWIKAITLYVVGASGVPKKSKAAQLRGDVDERHDVTSKVDFKSGVDREGWLTKSGSNGRNWKRRWCVIKEVSRVPVVCVCVSNVRSD